MKFNKIQLLNLFLLAAFVFQALASAEVVYDNTSAVTSAMWTTEVGDTVTLAGTKRFINSFTLGMVVGSHIGETENLILRFYLPNAPNESPGRLIWQSPPLTNVPLTEEEQLITLNVPEIRVPDTFIWCTQHGGSAGFGFSHPPTVGSSPDYAWTNLTKYDSSIANFTARIEATDRSDADLLGTISDDGWCGLGTDERYNMRFNLFASAVGLLKGPAFVGISEWDVGTFPSVPAEDYPQFVEILTNGLDDNITRYAEYGGNIYPESDMFTKSPGIAEGYPDFYGCIITDIVLKLDNIIIDHSTPGWTYFTWDVTWEIWGIQKSTDINRDGKVNLLDFSILASAWYSQAGQPNWNPLCDIYLPEDNQINFYDVQRFCSDWLYGSSFALQENFETGDFSLYPWQHLGDAAWNITTDSVIEGTYAAKSGAITHNQESILQIEVDAHGEQVSFYKKVSSEEHFDYLRFYIDGVKKAEWSGESWWSPQSFPVTPGIHTFKWSYEKDGSISTGSDCAWLDLIIIE